MIIVRNLESAIPRGIVPVISPSELNAILGNVASSARNHWIKRASEDSSSFSGDYVRGIQPAVAQSANRHVVALVGEIPHMLEKGSPRLDMRDTLLGPNDPVAKMGERGKHKTKDGGFFRAIPFRHTAPGAGKASGRSMGSAYAGHDAISDSRKLGRDVYKSAKSLSATRTSPYGKTQWGGRLNVPSVPLLKAHHKSSIYQGMVRKEKTYEKATQNQYFTFRTISTSVVGDSWIRKPIEARNYAVKVSEFVSKMLPDAVSAYFEGNK